MRKYKRHIQVALWVAIALEILIIILLVYALLIGSPVVVLHVTSGSMNPTIRPGGYVLLGGHGPEKDAIIAFYDPSRGEIIVHRVIGTDGECFVTKGDDTDFPDFYKPCPESILGRVILIF
jgi:signal peptidase I